VAFSDGLDIDRLLTLYHSECEWRMGSMGAAFGAEAIHGHDGLRAWVAAINEGFDSFAVEIDEARVTASEELLLRGHATAHSRDRHIDLSIPTYWQEIGFRDDLIASVVHLDDPPLEWDGASPLDLGIEE
jgi:hypothetical protein